MKNNMLFCNPADSRLYTEEYPLGFKFIKTVKGEKYEFNTEENFMIVFILKGKAVSSCNGSAETSFSEREILLWPTDSCCTWESVTDTQAIVLTGEKEFYSCEKRKFESIDKWLNAIPSFKGLAIKPRLMEYLQSIKEFLEDNISCKYMHKTKKEELALILRGYYPPEVLVDFFVPLVCRFPEFENMAKEHYLKTVNEKAAEDKAIHTKPDILSNRVKTYLKQGPHEWLVRHKSGRIYNALISADKDIQSIAKEFHFADANHLKQYCKAMFNRSFLSDKLEAKLNECG